MQTRSQNKPLQDIIEGRQETPSILGKRHILNTSPSKASSSTRCRDPGCTDRGEKRVAQSLFERILIIYLLFVSNFKLNMPTSAGKYDYGEIKRRRRHFI